MSARYLDPVRTRRVRSLEQVEKRYIQAIVRAYDGRKAAAAAALGISLKTLYNKLNRYELEPSTRTQP